METVGEKDGSWVGLTLDEQLAALRRGHLGFEYYQGVARAMNAVPLAWFGEGSDDKEDFIWLFDFLGFDLDDVDSLWRVRLGEGLVRLDGLVRRCVAGEDAPDERERLADDVMRALRRLLDIELFYRVLKSRTKESLKKYCEKRLNERAEARRSEMLEELGDADGLRRLELAGLLWGSGSGGDQDSYEKRVDWTRLEQWGPVRRFGNLTIGQLFDGVGQALGEDLDGELELALSFDESGILVPDDSVREVIIEAQEDFRIRRSRWLIRHDPSAEDPEDDVPDFFDDLIDSLDYLGSDDDDEDDPSEDSSDDPGDEPAEDSPDSSLSHQLEFCIDQSVFYRLFVRPLALLERCGR